MKLNYLIFLFYFLSTSCFGCNSIEELRATFSIQNEVLMNQKGERFSRYPFESKLHFDLAYMLKDLDLANQIHTAYKIHILPTINTYEEEIAFDLDKSFIKALVEISHYFGSPDYSPLIPLQRALARHGQSAWVERYPRELQSFVEDASTPLYSLYQKDKTDPFTVVILTTTCSGGNHSVALSIAHSLQARNIQTFLLDVEEIAKEYDPMMIATGTYTYDMVYSHILQRNNSLEVIKTRKKLYREIEAHIPNNFLRALKNKVISLKPDLIISTRSYTCDDLSLATLGVPFCLCHADYELCPSLSSYYRCIPSERIRFWVPTLKSSMFKPLFDFFNHLDIYDEADEEATVFEKLSKIMQTSVEKLRKNFELIGYPCVHFYPIKEKQSLKKKWGVAPDEIPVFIVMGKYSTGSLRDIFDHLKQAKKTLPLKYIFICGKNETLKAELEKTAPPTMLICGLLSPNEMNEVMNLSALGISKAGGATTAEAMITKTPLLLLGSYPWEEVNANHLIKAGLGRKVDPNIPLIQQIEQILQADKVADLKSEEWEKNLSHEIDLFLQEAALRSSAQGF